MNKLTTKALTWIDALTVYEDERQSSSLYYDESDADITVPDLKALATAFRALHDCALKCAALGCESCKQVKLLIQ